MHKKFAPFLMLLGFGLLSTAYAQDDSFAEEDEPQTSAEVDGGDGEAVEASVSDDNAVDQAEPDALTEPASDLTDAQPADPAGTEGIDSEVQWDPNDPRNAVNGDVGVGRPVSREDNEGG